MASSTWPDDSCQSHVDRYLLTETTTTFLVFLGQLTRPTSAINSIASIAIDSNNKWRKWHPHPWKKKNVSSKKKKSRLSSVLPWQPKRLNSTGRNWKRPNKGRMNRRLIGNFEAGWLVARKPIANYWAIGERSVAAWFSYTWALYCNWFV